MLKKVPTDRNMKGSYARTITNSSFNKNKIEYIGAASKCYPEPFIKC